MFDEIIADAREGMDKAIKGLERDLAKTRTGRANLSMLDGIRVEYYGAPTPLNQVAALTVADARLITVKPWDRTLLGGIERVLIASDLGITPSNDGEVIRLPIPPLTQERRQDLSKQVRRYGEDAKVAIRNLRRDANDLVRAEEGTSEDDVNRALKSIQDLTDREVKRVDELVSVKEGEILEG